MLYEIQDVLALEGLKMDYVSRVRMEVVIHNLIRAVVRLVSWA